MINKLLSNNRWSSKKFAGLSLVATAIILSFIIIIKGVTSEELLLVSIILSAAAAYFGIDGVNKYNRLKHDKTNNK